MSFSAAAWLVILFAVIAANLPFVNERLFVIGPLRQPKSLALRDLAVGQPHLIAADVEEGAPIDLQRFERALAQVVVVAVRGEAAGQHGHARRLR